MAPKAQNREIKDETPKNLGNNPSADLHKKEETPQKELTIALKDQFVANRHLLRSPRCQPEQLGQLTNNGKGGGPLCA